MKALNLSDIAVALGVKESAQAAVTGISIDSRSISQGDLYIAIKGERFDGHSFIASAIENGASAIICSKGDNYNCPYIKVKDTSQAFLDLAKWYRGLFDIPLVALTGSVGKTTTKEMISAVLSSKYNTLKTQGNLNNQIGVPRTIMGLDDTIQAAVIEMGMDNKGQISQLSRCANPTCAVITNIGVSHMENLGSREGILAAKLEIVDGLRENAPLFLNGDDPYLMSAKIENRAVFYYGINNTICDFKATNIVSSAKGSEFDIIHNGNTTHIALPAIGKHNIYNATAAFAVGIQNGVSPAEAAQGLLSYEPSGMRQRIKEVNGIVFIEDCYNASPDSVRAALSTLASLDNQRKIAVLGDMLELGSVSEEAHRTSGLIAAKKGIDAVLTYGERSELTAKTAQEMGVSLTESFLSHKKLASYLVKYLSKGDAVLFKASRGMELEKVIQAVYDKLS